LLKETSRGSVYSEDLPPPTLSAFANRPFCDGHHIGLTTCATRARGRANFCEPVLVRNGAWGRALALRSSCDGHHKKALFIAELRKKNRAFLTAPAPAGISSDLMQSVEATDDCGRTIGLCAHAQIRDDGPNMETYHEGTYRSSRVGYADCGPDIRSFG
jgi:hypothetical protein